LTRELRAFLDAPSDGAPPEVDFDVAVRCMEVVPSVDARLQVVARAQLARRMRPALLVT